MPDDNIVYPYSIFDDFYSVSSISTALECTLKHHFKYSVGIPTKENGNLLLGKAIHHAIEHFHFAHSDKDIDSVRQDIFQSFHDKWDAYLAEFPHVLSPEKKTPEKLYYMGLLLLSRYLDNRKGVENPQVISYQDKNMIKPKPSLELEFRVPMLDLKTGEPIVQRDLYGFMDIIEKDDKYGVAIWDHKTSAKDYTKFRLSSDIQLILYAYAFRYLLRQGAFPDLDVKQEQNVGFNLMIKPPFKVDVIKADHEKIKSAKCKKVPMQVTDKQIMGVFNIIKSVDRALASGDPYPSWSGDCSWKCDYNKECIDWKNLEFEIPKNLQKPKRPAKNQQQELL